MNDLSIHGTNVSLKPVYKIYNAKGEFIKSTENKYVAEIELDFGNFVKLVYTQKD